MCVGVLDDEIRVRYDSSGQLTFTSQRSAQRLLHTHCLSLSVLQLLFTVNASESDILSQSVLKLKIN